MPTKLNMKTEKLRSQTHKLHKQISYASNNEYKKTLNLMSPFSHPVITLSSSSFKSQAAGKNEKKYINFQSDIPEFKYSDFRTKKSHLQQGINRVWRQIHKAVTEKLEYKNGIIIT